MTETGFIILRHVNNKQTNEYWQECYRRIRTFYPEHKIIIIDDNSDSRFVTEMDLYNNARIIQSEYPARGEWLPYYYYLQNKDFDRAVILHGTPEESKPLLGDIHKYCPWGKSRLTDDTCTRICP